MAQLRIKIPDDPELEGEKFNRQSPLGKKYNAQGLYMTIGSGDHFVLMVCICQGRFWMWQTCLPFRTLAFVR